MEKLGYKMGVIELQWVGARGGRKMRTDHLLITLDKSVDAVILPYLEFQEMKTRTLIS
jgi:hypothetical protein